ncbi:MAG: hypothetical protein JNM58_06035 [Xanthomonadaceae bacterium]|nr:hypothetical protein [Xanthomonadaceae bacterium]
MSFMERPLHFFVRPFEPHGRVLRVNEEMCEESTISKEEILAFLHAIESGDVVLTARVEPQFVYAGIVLYDASNGWQIAVFNDANAWDYIEWIVAADGRRLDFEGISEEDGAPVSYTPSDEVAWRRYGIPGYLQNRCTRCSTSIDAQPGGIYLCAQCAQ